MSGSISRVLVHLMGRYPFVAFLFLVFTIPGIYFEIDKATLANATRDKPAIRMRIERVYDVMEWNIFPRFRAAGKTRHESVVVPISRSQSKLLRIGNILHILETGDPDRPYLERNHSIDTRRRIRFSVGRFAINDIAIWNTLLSLALVVWGSFGRAIARWFSDDEDETENSTNGKTE